MANKPAPVEAEIEISDQCDFYKLPARFGAIPLDEALLGYEVDVQMASGNPKIQHGSKQVDRFNVGVHSICRKKYGVSPGLWSAESGENRLPPWHL